MFAETRADENLYLPSISIVIPTYNSERTLGLCLDSISNQDYPKDKLEILIADGGSKDKTLEISRKFGVSKIASNPLRTGEAGKAVGVELAKNEVVLLQDSDNILDDSNWLRKMVQPFSDEKIVGTEPLCYTYRRHDPLIVRYCALIGMNDPMCLYLGNYDRYSYVTGKWCGFRVDETDRGSYILLRLNKKEVPTIGANGFLVRRKNIRSVDFKPYLFDIDAIYELVNMGQNQFAKVKIGIVHLFADNPRTFVRKTYRRIRDFRYYSKHKMRKYPWNSLGALPVGKFVLYTLIVFPTVRDSVKGYSKKRDRAWLFHPLACYLTLLVYGIKMLSTLG